MDRPFAQLPQRSQTSQLERRRKIVLARLSQDFPPSASRSFAPGLNPYRRPEDSA
jgi:hypothetical protein